MARLLLPVAALFALLGVAIFSISGSIDIRSMFGVPEAEAIHGGADEMIFDLDPSQTPANTAANLGSPHVEVLGTNQTCARIQEDGIQNFDEDAVDAIFVDATVRGIPASNAIIGWNYTLLYSDANLQVTAENQAFILAANSPSNLFSTSDTAPDATVNGQWTAGSLDTGTGAPEFGDGVLNRLTIASTPTAIAGVYTLGMQFPVTIDANADAYYPHNVDAESSPMSGLDTVSNAGLIAINTACPPPVADLAVQSVDPVNVALTSQNTGSLFTAVVSGVIINNGPATANATTTFTLTDLADCTETPVGGATLDSNGILSGATVNVSKTFNVTCTSPSTHVFGGSIAVADGTPDISDDPDLTNNGPTNAATDSINIISQQNITATNLVLNVDDGGDGEVFTGTPFDVDFTGSIQYTDTSVGGVVPTIQVDIFYDQLNPPSGCGMPAQLQDLNFVLMSGVPYNFSKTWLTTCTTTGMKTFQGNVSVSIDTLHVQDPTPINAASNTDSTTAVTSADLKLTSPTVDSPAGATTGMAFNVTASANLHNNGPDVVNVNVTWTLNMPGDCNTVTANPQVTSLMSVPVSATAPTTPPVPWSVTCTQPSFHDFTVTVSAAPTNGSDPTPGNNSGTSPLDTTPVTANADVKFVSAQLQMPANAPVDTDFNVPATATIHNNGPFGPVSGSVQLLSSAPAPDCTAPAGTVRNVAYSNLAVSVAMQVNTGGSPFVFNCGTVGPVQGALSVGAISITTPPQHMNDPNPGNNTGNSPVANTTITAAADLKVTGVALSAPMTGNTGVPFNVTATPTVHNNGPETPIDASVTVTLNVPADCIKTPNTTQQGAANGLATSVSTPMLGLTWSVTCTSVSDHNFTASATGAITTPNVTDSNPSNNTNIASNGQVTAISGDADPSVVSVVVDAPATAQSGVPFNVTVTANLANSGPTTPVNVDVLFDLQVPGPSCIKSPVGTQTTNDLSLGATAMPSQVWSVTCTMVGATQLGATVVLTLDQLHVTDTNTGNNGGAGNDTTTVLGSADLKIVSVTVTTPPTANVGDVISVSGTVVVHNNGPQGVALMVTLLIVPPADCVFGTPFEEDTQDGVTVSNVSTPVIFMISGDYICSQTSNHIFTVNATVSENDPLITDPNPNNNIGSGNDTTAISGTTDVKVTASSLIVPSAAQTNIPFNVTMQATLHNNGPAASANTDVTFDLDPLPAGCTTGSTDPAVQQDVALPISSAVVRQATWSVTCTTEAMHAFSASVAVAVDQLHLTDSNTQNDGDTSGGTVDVAQPEEADIKVTSVVVDAPDTASAGDTFPVTVTATVHNNGPQTAVSTQVVINLSVPADCTVVQTDNTNVGDIVILDISTPIVIVDSFEVNCDEPSFHQFDGSAIATVVTPGVFDPNQANNTGSGDDMTGITGGTDVKVTAMTVNAPFSADANESFNVTTSAQFHNNGPQASVNAAYTLGLTAPADCTVQPTGATAGAIVLPLSVTLGKSLTWAVTCTDGSAHIFEGSTTIAVDELHVGDSDEGNNAGDSSDTTNVRPEPTPGPSDTPPPPTGEATPTPTPTEGPTPTPTDTPPPTATPTDGPTPPPTDEPTPPPTDEPTPTTVPATPTPAPATPTPVTTGQPAGQTPTKLPPTGGSQATGAGIGLMILLLAGSLLIAGGAWAAWNNRRTS